MADLDPSSDVQHRVDRLHSIRIALRDILDDLPTLLNRVTPEDDVDKEDLQGSLALVRDYLANDLVAKTYTHSPEDSRGRQPINATFVDTVEGACRNIANELASQETLSLVGWEAGRLKRQLQLALERSHRREFSFLTVSEQTALEAFADRISDRLGHLDKSYALEIAAKRAEDAAASAKASASKASDAASTTAENTMAEHYEALGKEEQKTANAFRGWAILLGAVAGALALTFLSGGAVLRVGWLNIAAGDYVSLIQRALVLAAFLALATYLARQAHQHRTMGNWARSLAVQLRTFDAFIDAIDDATTKNELRKDFAVRVFGEHPAVKGEPALSASSQGVTALTEAVAKLVPATK